MMRPAAALTTIQARADGLQRVDLVALSTDGQRLWGVQPRLGGRTICLTCAPACPLAIP